MSCSSKGSPEFFEAILGKLNILPINVAMVGDHFDKDIKPAISVGIKAFWFTQKNIIVPEDNVRVIKKLNILCR